MNRERNRQDLNKLIARRIAGAIEAREECPHLGFCEGRCSWWDRKGEPVPIIETNFNRYRPTKPLKVSTRYGKAVGRFDAGSGLRLELQALKAERDQLQYRIALREKELRQLEGLEPVSFTFIGTDWKWSVYRTVGIPIPCP